jgi:Plant transposon protein
LLLLLLSSIATNRPCVSLLHFSSPPVIRGNIPATYLVAGVAVAALVSMALITDEEKRQRRQELPAQLATTLLNAVRQKRRGQDDADQVRAKRAHLNWNRDRARLCVEEDYWGPYPRFRDRDFERVFRITRTRADFLLNLLGNSDEFFQETVDCLGKRSICPKVKFLMALKLLCYGVSPSAFQDYFQMGISTAHECLKKFCSIISKDEDLTLRYRRRMNRADARRLSELHYYHHGFSGIVGSLDCMHIFWKQCPVGWQGAYQGAKKAPTIILEAVADYNLFLWHSSFSHPGSLNDLNVWDRSELLVEFIDGTFA